MVTQKQPETNTNTITNTNEHRQNTQLTTRSTWMYNVRSSMQHWMRKQQAAPKRPFKKYTAEQVAQHNSEGDCWTILHGHVYDITDYAPFHPYETQRKNRTRHDTTRHNIQSDWTQHLQASA